MIELRDVTRTYDTPAGGVVAIDATGNLDSETADMVLSLFRELADAGTTVLLATHERDIARLASRVVHLQDGRVVDQSDTTSGGPDQARPTTTQVAISGGADEARSTATAS